MVVDRYAPLRLLASPVRPGHARAITIPSTSYQSVALKPNKKIHWRVTAGPPEWIGTNITFDLTQEDGMTIVLFGHRNWKRPVEFMGHCSMKWATFLLSLRDLVEKGKGKPSPHDLKIDNWN